MATLFQKMTAMFDGRLDFFLPGFVPLHPKRFCAVAICAFWMLPIAHAARVQMLDGKSFDGAIQFTDSGSLIFTPTQQESISIELTNVARATFAPGPFVSSGSILPNGWAAQDIGETRGFVRLDGDAFTLRVEGQSTNATACHFISRTMPSDGQLIARVEQVAGNGSAQAGIMIRGHSGSSFFAALSLGNDGKLSFQRRPDPDRRETKLTSGPAVTAPVWLRLQKYDKTLTASWSADGRTWQTIASDTTKLVLERTWRESEGELYLLRASCGVFASSRGKDTVSTARVVPVTVMLQGVLGEYFAGQDFRQLKFARLDPQIHFHWSGGSPDPALDAENFSVRWTGQLMVPKSGPYCFYFEADNHTRLWINGTEIPPTSLKKPERGKSAAPAPVPVSLLKGELATMKMEFENHESPAAVKLCWGPWGLSSKTPEVIGMTNFFYVLTPTNSPERIALARVTNNTPGVRGLLLRDGSFIAGTVREADSSAVKISFAGRKEVPVLNSKIARIFLKPSPRPLPFEITRGRSGVFMKNGDFFESEFHSIHWGTLMTSSVLFGLKRFNADGESLVVVLNDFTPPNTGFEVRLLDGSMLRSPRLIANAQTITVEEPVLGNLSVPVADLFEIVHLPARME